MSDVGGDVGKVLNIWFEGTRELRDYEVNNLVLVLLVSGGTVTGASRVDGRKDLGEITVQPAGNGAGGTYNIREEICT